MIVFTCLNYKKQYNDSISYAQDCVERYCTILRMSSNTLNTKLKNPRVLKDKLGKPYVEDGSLYLSISHTSSSLIKGDDNVIAVAISNEAVGIDIEIPHRIDYQKIAKRYFSEKEIKSISSILDFFVLWTKKEAYYKALSNQENKIAATLDVSENKNFGTYYIYDNIVLSLYSNDKNIYFYV